MSSSRHLSPFGFEHELDLAGHKASVDQDPVLGPTLTRNEKKVDGATAQKINGLPTPQLNNPTTIFTPCLLQVGEIIIATHLWIRFRLIILYIKRRHPHCANMHIKTVMPIVNEMYILDRVSPLLSTQS